MEKVQLLLNSYSCPKLEGGGEKIKDYYMIKLAEAGLWRSGLFKVQRIGLKYEHSDYLVLGIVQYSKQTKGLVPTLCLCAHTLKYMNFNVLTFAMCMCYYLAQGKTLNINLLTS